MKKRLFISIPVSQEYQDVLGKVPRATTGRDLKWVDPAQYHITVCFLGDVEEPLLILISDALERLAKQTKPFAMPLDRLGFFPTKMHPPLMIWAFFKEIEAYANLVKAAKESLMRADSAFLSLGEEWRKDIAHVTLARIRGRDYPRQAPTLATALPPLNVDAIELMESQLYPDGPVYTSLARFPFSV
jgi:2'-5' RNA ligase